MNYVINKSDPYRTHQPVLAAIAPLCSSIIELGCGEGSTELLHHISPRAEILTVDHDKEWLAKYEARFVGGRHQFQHMTFSEIAAFCAGLKKADLIFIDQGDWTNRWDCLLLVKDKARFVIVHDSDVYPEAAAHFKYSATFMPEEPRPGPTGPPTFIGSNFEPIPAVDMKIKEIEL